MPDAMEFINTHFMLSSFNIRRIQNLTANPLKIKPAVNQVELSYWNPQPELVKVNYYFYVWDKTLTANSFKSCQWAKENGLLLEAYSPLGSEGKVKESLQIPEVHLIVGSYVWSF